MTVIIYIINSTISLSSYSPQIIHYYVYQEAHHSSVLLEFNKLPF